jgi:hypothetical protein
MGEPGMSPSELELFSTRELIDEIVRRQTFLGIIVHSTDEMKGRRWNGEKTFQVRFNTNLNWEEASRLLGVVTEYMNRDC